MKIEKIIKVKFLKSDDYYYYYYYYGERFAVKGNIYHDGEPRWSHFTDYFVCTIQRERDNKLTEIGI